MNPHVRTGLWALAFTALLAVAMKLSAHPSVSAVWVDTLVSAPVWTAFYLAVFFGIGGGPDGHPNMWYVYGLAFVLWRVVFELCFALWRSVRGG